MYKEGGLGSSLKSTVKETRSHVLLIDLKIRLTLKAMNGSCNSGNSSNIAPHLWSSLDGECDLEVASAILIFYAAKGYLDGKIIPRVLAASSTLKPKTFCTCLAGRRIFVLAT